MNRKEILKIAKPILFDEEMVRAILEGRKTETRRVIKSVSPNGEILNSIPPCKPGDYLYVREAFARLTGPKCNRFVYKASDTYPFGEKYIAKFRWHPSVHMPKEAARIFLRVTDVRAERLREIFDTGKYPEGPDHPVIKEGFKSGCEFIPGWDSRIPKKDREKYGWKANPWVWIITFEMVNVKEDLDEILYERVQKHRMSCQLPKRQKG